MDSATNTLLLNMSSALVQSILLGTALTFVVALSLRTLASPNAATRFAVWFGTLVVVALLSIASLVTAEAPGRSEVRRPSPEVAAATQIARAAEPVAMPVAGPVRAASNAVPDDRSAPLRIPIDAELPVVLLIAYGFVVCFLAARLAFGFIRLRRLVRRSRPAPENIARRFDEWLRLSGCRRSVRLLLSIEGRSPMAVGFARPAVIIPDALLLGLSGEDLDHIGLHELAHLRRYDDWTNLIQKVLRAALFFHPAVHWISRRLDLEREVACDDRVLSITREPKPYARSLTKILELAPGRRPILASGAVFGKRQIIRRIEMMLDGSRDKRPGISQVSFAIILVLVVGIASELAKMPALFGFDGYTGSHVSRWTSNGRTVETEMRGEVEFGDDDGSITRMGPGAYFRIEEKRGWTRRKLEARPGATPEIRYFVDGAERRLDDAAREWFARLLLEIIRESGVNAEERALRILERRGASGVIEEIDRISSDSVRRRYLAAVIDSGKLSIDDLRRAMHRASRISSDHEKANLLLHVVPEYDVEGLHTAFFDAVDTINSDHDRRRVLSKVLEENTPDSRAWVRVGRSIEKMQSDHDKAELLKSARFSSIALDSEALKAMIRATESIQSDHDKANVITSMLDDSNVGEDAVSELMHIAAKITSDNDKSRVLRRAVERNVLGGAARTAFFAAVDTLNSDSDRASVLTTLMQRAEVDPGTATEVAAAAQKLNSDNDKANVLIQVANRCVSPSFLSAVRTISSDNDKRRVLSHVLERDVPPDIAKAVIETAGTINSDNDKAQVLTAAAQRYTDRDVREQVRRVAETLHSDGDYRRIVSKLFEAPAETTHK